MAALFEKKFTSVAALAGIAINGSEPWDLQVQDKRIYRQMALYGSLGLGEAYMNGWFDCQRLDLFFEKVGLRLMRQQLPELFSIKTNLINLWARIVNLQSKSKAFIVGEKHYDLGNKLFIKMLDPAMNYSCGYWKEADSLEQAQQAKLDLVFRKLGLKPGMKVLDIGCGWGTAAKFAAQKYGVEVTGITISKEQANFAIDSCKGLPVKILLQDYRDLQGQFDRVWSIGMFEHVGTKNYRTYMQQIKNVLREDGLFVLHTIGSNRTIPLTDPWINRYIFPNGKLPGIQQAGHSLEGNFVMEDWQNFGADYDLTLMCWYHNIEQYKDMVIETKGHRFYRMWTYYLLSCAGMFRARRIQLWQLVLSPYGIKGRYDAPR